MEGEHEKFWAEIPRKALHPRRYPIIEAFWWMAEPLSAIALVDVLDGDITMWEAVRHLQALDALDVVEPDPSSSDEGESEYAPFYAPYCLKGRGAVDGD
jgi:hypothetical protein